jgi:hypothetical protein
MENRISGYRVFLTHRKDLKDYYYPTKEGMFCLSPRQQISGVLEGLGYGGFSIKNKELGLVWVETNKKIFEEKKDREWVREAFGKPVDIAIDDTGKNLSVTVHNEKVVSVFRQRFQTPIIPMGLITTSGSIDGGKCDFEISGKLTHVHNKHTVEIAEQGNKPRVVLLPRDLENDKQRELKKLIGHDVKLTMSTTGESLKVVDLTREPQKQKGLSR